MSLKKLLSATVVATVFALSACGDKSEKIKVGVMSGPEHQIAELAAKIAKEKYNRDVELVSFTDYGSPNEAVHKGDLDANAFQHKPYLDKDSADNGFKLSIVGNTFVYPIAAYSKKIKSLDELKEGSSIAIPNNPTNLGRSLLLLEKQGLIKLKDSTNLLSTKLDIVDNPRNLDIREVDGELLTRVLDDVEFAIINNTFAGQIGLSPDKDGLFVESKESPYVNLIVTRQGNENNEAIKDFVKSYQTEEVYQEALKLFQGGVVKGW
ncbi:YaeC family lipoprotein [Actinobacillus indolicus]|nr:YaeC family lipoprotein [Actinobacillus indolicus]VTU07446.1 YaeC family lipoprotein [Actinobacillus indolicus]